MTLNEYLIKIEDFLESYLLKSGCKGYVLGLSGGVDSSLAAAICRKKLGKDKLTCLMIPIESNKDDLKDAMDIAHILDINYYVIDANAVFKEQIKSFLTSHINLDDATLANLKVRIRMSILYAFAQQNNLLVIGTDNKDEIYTGYFTKYGDGACDVLPLAHLLKKEVVEAAKMYGLPNYLAERIPTAGLFQGQTDESEMKVTYKDLDSYLLGNEVPKQIKNRIEHLHSISEHKRIEIPKPGDFEREK